MIFYIKTITSLNVRICSTYEEYEYEIKISIVLSRFFEKISKFKKNH